MTEEPQSGADKNPPSDLTQVPIVHSPSFWRTLGFAAGAGIALGVLSLAFLGLLKGGTKLWFTLPSDPGWFDGKLWWVAVTVGAGVIVGVLRHTLHVPAKLPGTFDELKDGFVDPKTTPAAVLVSLVSLIGGASLGPEDALGKLGGSLGTLFSRRRKLSDDERTTNTRAAMAGSYGGLLASPLLSTMMTVEAARPKAREFTNTLVASLLCATIAFAVYFPIAGSTFVGIYSVPAYKFEDWQLLAAIPLGLVAGAVALLTIITVALMKRLLAPLARRTLLTPAVGGLAFGLIGVALPLTLFTGTDQLDVIIRHGAALGFGLLIAVVLGKILVFALCEATGFIGGPILVMLFVGGTVGVAVHLLIPGLPEGFCFATMFASIIGALVAAPFTLIFFAALTTQVGTLQVAPVGVAVITAYLAVTGTGTLAALARRGREQAGPRTPAKPSPPG